MKILTKKKQDKIMLTISELAKALGTDAPASRISFFITMIAYETLDVNQMKYLINKLEQEIKKNDERQSN